MKFLVVDDSRVARQRVISYLNDLNYEVVGEAVDGIDAIEKFKTLTPCAIALDLEMPNMKGIEASKKILEIDPTTKIILITSIIDKKEIINALRIGVKKVIRKPFTKEKLQEIINEL